ncbi:MAG: hypothetical protein M1837_002562 [Sclerophora amabilis]|nr:MAG: hypothetical protein M1837_002562 [Sclerophora amabilis]
MPWRPLRRIAFAVAIYPFQASSPADLPLELGDELYIIEQGGVDGSWYRGYLVAPPSLLAGLTSVKGQTLEARVFSGIFPSSFVEVRELLGEARLANGKRGGTQVDEEDEHGHEAASSPRSSISQSREVTNGFTGDSSNPTGNDRSAHDVFQHDLAKSHDLQHAKQRLLDKERSNPAIEPSLSASHSRKKFGKRKDGNLAQTYSLHSVVSQKSQRSMSPLLYMSASKERDPHAPKPPAPVPMLKVGDETPTSAEEPLVDEIASCLREWHSTNLHELLLTKQYSLVHKTSTFVQQLDFSRRQLLHNVLTNNELEHLRKKVVWDLVGANKELSGEVVVRDPSRRGRILTGDESAVDITRLQSIMSLLDEMPTQHQEPSTLHHLLLTVKPAAEGLTDKASLEFCLCSKLPGGNPRPLSEVFSVDRYGNDTSGKVQPSAKLQTLFTDLSTIDVGGGSNEKPELFLVVKVKVDKNLVKPSPVDYSGPNLPRTPSTTNKPNQSPGSRGPSGTMKGGRRSLMWPQKGSGGSSRGRNVQIPQPAALNQEDQPPKTADSAQGSMTPSNGPVNPSQIPSRDQAAAPSIAKQLVGVGTLRIDQMMQSDNEVSRSLQIWSPVSPRTSDQHHEEGWNELVRGILERPASQLTKSSVLERIHLQLNSFLKPDADSLITETPTLLQNVVQTRKIGFSGAPTKPRSDVYFTLCQVVLPRHALLSHPKLGSTQLPHHSNYSNLQVTLEVRTPSGDPIENCIFPSSNSPGVTTWESTIIDNQSTWDSTVKLAIPPDTVATCHVVATIADAPGPPFAFSWMPLWDQQAFMRDGAHFPLLYKYDEWTSHPTSSNMGKGGYLSLPWNSKGRDDLSKDEAVTGPLATLRVQSYLCSTVFSQDKVLLGLLRWRDQLPGDLMEILRRVVFVPEIEIVKLLSEVFDSLFGILVEQAGNDDYEDLVFSALVTVLGIVHDRRFNVGPLVDQYAESQFRYPFATPCLIRSFTRLLSNPAGMESSRKLRATFKVGRHILKFIINAREQQKAKEAGIGITSTQPTFTRELRSIFRALEALMRNPVPTLVGSQTLAVQHFHTWIPELMGYLDDEDILRTAIGFMESCDGVKGKLILYRLILLVNYSRLDIFSQNHARRTLVVNTTRWLSPVWGKTDHVNEQWREQVRLCCSVLSSQMDGLEEEVAAYIPKVIESYRCIQATERPERTTLSLLFPTTYPFPSRITKEKCFFDEAMLELAAILGSLCCLPKPVTLHYPELEVSGFLRDALLMHRSILDSDAFPRNWTSVRMYHHRSSMKTLECLGRVLMESFIPEPDEAENFDTDLWHIFFSTLFKLVGSDALTLENFPEQKRRAAWQIAGDVREQGANLLRRTWEAIGWETSPDDQNLYGLEKMGGYQVQYVPGLVPSIIELCLSVHGGLRNVAVEVLQSMIVSEWTLNQDLSVIQAEMIDCLDRLFKSKLLNESILQNSFTTELQFLFEQLSQSPEDPMYLSLKHLLDTMDEFLDLLVAANTTDLSGEASTIMHTLRLMEFLKDMQKVDIYIRYVHQLAQLQVQSRNYAEAGLALRYHADLYSWDPMKTNDALDDPEYPRQSDFERKERLYFEMVKQYEEGESWGMALAAYKELSEQYEYNVFDFAKLARTQRAMAKVHEAIAKGQRHSPRYFRVVYQGMGFPSGVRDKQFIFEGPSSERLPAFADRMQEQYPSARLAPSGEIEDVEGQFLQISTVSPQRDLLHPVFQRPKISQAIRDHSLFYHPSQFAVTTRRSPNANDVKDHWVEKVVYTTAEAFPSILKRSEIIATEEIRLSPIQSAIERTTRKTQELLVSEKRVVEGNESEIPTLIEAIHASVDPTSDVSVARYRELLSSKEPTKEEETSEKSEEDALDVALRVALSDHATALRRCLGLCSRAENYQQSISHADLYRSSYSHGLPPLRETKLTITGFHYRYAAEIASFETTSNRPPSSKQQATGVSAPFSVFHQDNNGPTPPLSPVPQTNGSLDLVNLDKKVEKAKREENRLSLRFLKRSANDGNASKMLNGNNTRDQHDNVDENLESFSGLPTKGSNSTQNRSRGSFVGGGLMSSQEEIQPDHPRRDEGGGGSRTDPVTNSGRRSASSTRPQTSASQRPQTSASQTSTSVFNGVGGSVKKRFSMLKMGKKENKSNPQVNSVREE